MLPTSTLPSVGIVSALQPDPLDVPSCPEHLVSLRIAGDEADGSDARWECDIPGCNFVRLA